MAKDKKGNGEGSIFKLKDGTWRGFITIGFDSKGKQVKKWRRGTTRREVADKLNEIAAQTGSRLVTRPERATIEEWLRHFADLRGHEVRHRTRANYQHYLSKILPELGHFELQNLKPLQVRSFYKKLTEQGLSPSVKKHIHFFLKAAFNDAFHMAILRTGLRTRHPEGKDMVKSGIDFIATEV